MAECICRTHFICKDNFHPDTGSLMPFSPQSWKVLLREASQAHSHCGINDIRTTGSITGREVPWKILCILK